MEHPEQTPAIPPVVAPELAAQHPDLQRQDVPCLNCGYNLRGLQEDGRCPECGTPVERSLRGNLLVYSSVEHLKRLHTGVFLILTGIILQIFSGVGTIIAGAVLSSPSAAGMRVGIEVGRMMVSFCISGILLYGWWLFSAPDPAIIGANTGSSARQAVRVTVVISATIMVVHPILEYAVPASMTSGTIMNAATQVNFLAMMVKFFLAMVYLRWLAPRLPDERVFKRAKLLMWLVPVLVLVTLCTLSISLLIALVLYWNMLDWVRRDLKEIRAARLRDLDASPEF